MISLAHAQTAGAASDAFGGLGQLLPLILMFVVLWFLMIRPQMKKAKEHKALIAALARGRRSRHPGRHRRPHHQGRRKLRLGRDRRRHRSRHPEAVHRPGVAQGHAEVAVITLEGGRWPPSSHSGSHESLSPLEVHHRRRRAGAGLRLYAAQLLRRIAGGAGFQRQGHAQGRPEDAGQRRGSAESRRHRPQRHPARLQRRQDPLQRYRHPVEGQETYWKRPSTPIPPTRSTSSR